MRPTEPPSNDTPPHHQHGAPVMVQIDGQPREVPDGVYKIPELSLLLGVAAGYILNLVRDGGFEDLAQGRSLHVRGGEVFVSQPPQGGSS